MDQPTVVKPDINEDAEIDATTDWDGGWEDGTLSGTFEDSVPLFLWFETDYGGEFTVTR